MKIRAVLVSLALALSVTSLPAHATDPEFERLADLPAGFNPSSNTSFGGPGSRIATTSNGQVMVYSDFSLFNNYSWNNTFSTVNGAVSGPSLYRSVDGGLTVAPLTGAPQADWGPVDMSSDGQIIIASHKIASIESGVQVNGAAVWVSLDGGTTFTKENLTSAWDVAVAGNGSVMVATEDRGNYIPKFRTAADPTWRALPLSAGHYRNTSISEDGSVIAICQQGLGHGIWISRDQATSFTMEIPNVMNLNEGCGPMEVSDDGQTLVIGRFANPDKKVFKRVGSNWSLVNTLVGVSAWHSTASVSVSADGAVVVIGDYQLNRLSISQDGGLTFTHYPYSATFKLSGAAYVTPDASKIFSFNQDGMFVMRLSAGNNTAPEVQPEPYQGPVIPVSAHSTEPGDLLVLEGERLASVSKVLVSGLETTFEATESQLRVVVPENLAEGLVDLILYSDFGKLTIQGALSIRPKPTPPTEGFSLRSTASGLKIYHMNPGSLGKVQIFVNGKERFWIRGAISPLVTASKLRSSSDGTTYLVRTLASIGERVEVSVLVDGKVVFQN